MKWLHSFGYEEAIAAFRAAQQLDPQFVMAYWGEAMAFNQPLWFHEDVRAGQAALAKLAPTPAARLAKAATPREQQYLAAVEALYTTQNKPARDQAHSDALAVLAAKFPDDNEAQAFYALSLLAILPRGDQSLPLRDKAGAIAERVFKRNPQHPGAPHYMLHAYDHGQLAARGLAAARAYAKIAPAASHALHMPAHAFVQLGLWGEAAATDERSWNASIAWATSKKLSIAMRDFHSLAWLQYEWTQQGRFTKSIEAARLVQQALAVVGTAGEVGGHHDQESAIGRGSGPMTLRNDLASMRARYIIESERWEETQGQAAAENIDELFAFGMAAAKMGNATRLSNVINALGPAASAGQDAGLREQAAIMLPELQALLAMMRGRSQEAFAAMDAATALQARMPKPIGRPYPVKGADELYGEILLQAGHAKEAVGWFERALTRTPNRSRAVIGLARASAKAGDPGKSRTAYKQFLVNYRLADQGLPEVREARAAVAAR
ncbi:MAG TPA: hypothetical protein VNJ02_16250 [Vicinamibacterales bacterium]|nr:hypothetical protein [Vicinamibacterales bacterium]